MYLYTKNTDNPLRRARQARRAGFITATIFIALPLILLTDQAQDETQAQVVEEPKTTEEIQITMAAQMYYIDERKVPVSIQQLHEEGSLKAIPEGYKASFDYIPGDYEHPHEGLVIDIQKVSS